MISPLQSVLVRPHLEYLGFAPSPQDEPQQQRGASSAKGHRFGGIAALTSEVMLLLRGFPLGKQEGFRGGSDSSF